MTRIRLPAWLKEVYGKINKGVVVFRRWKGRIVLEVDPSPSYTRTALQDSIRKFFKNCIQQWHQLSEAEKEQYNQEARKYGLTGYQYFIKQCMSHWAPAPEQYIEITITEQSGQDLTDYQVLLVVQNDQAFFDFVQDPTYIEIYDSDKTTQLSFYVEEWDSNNYNAKIWIKIPNLPANGTRKIYLYANPSRTTPLSDPEAVFDFFDDFNDLSKWTEVKDGNSYIAVNNSLLEIHNDGSNRAYARSNQQFSAPYVLEVRAKKVSNIQIHIHWDGLIAGNSDDLNNGYHAPTYATWVTPNAFKIIKRVNGSGQAIASVDYDLDTEFHIYKTIAKTTGIECYIDGNKILETTDTTFTSGYIGLSGIELTSGITSYYDWVRIRKYASPEPKVEYTILS